MPETGEILLFTEPDYHGQELVIHALIDDTVQIITLPKKMFIGSMKIDTRLNVQFFSSTFDIYMNYILRKRYSGNIHTIVADLNFIFAYSHIRITLKNDLVGTVFDNSNLDKTNTSSYDLGTSYNLNPNFTETSYDIITSYNLEPDFTETTYTSPDITDTSDDLSTGNTEIENAIMNLLNNVKDHNQLNLSDTLNSESINVDDIQENEKIINKNENEKKKENDQENENNHLFLFYTITILLGIIVVIVVYLYSV